MEQECPLYKEPCHEHRCKWYRPLTFEKDGQSETQWDCAINWNIFLLIENAKQMRGHAASADKMANEFRAGTGTLLLKLMEAPLPLENKG